MENNVRYIDFALNHLGILDLRIYNYNQALRNFNAGLDYRLKHCYYYNINFLKANIALCYKYLNDPDRANAIYREIWDAYQRREFQNCPEELLTTIRTSLE